MGDAKQVEWKHERGACLQYDGDDNYHHEWRVVRGRTVVLEFEGTIRDKERPEEPIFIHVGEDDPEHVEVHYYSFLWDKFVYISDNGGNTWLLAKSPGRTRGQPPTNVFFTRRGEPINSLDEWQAVVPAKDWQDGRSAKLLAESWFGACGFPPDFRRALHSYRLFEALQLERATVEVGTRTPGRGRGSTTDLLLKAGNERVSVVVAVEGKVDEGFDAYTEDWLVEEESPESRTNRRQRLDGICSLLQIAPSKVGGIRYQLLHRVYSAIRQATDDGLKLAIMAVHSFVPSSEASSGWPDFLSLAARLRDSAHPTPNGLWFAGIRSGVALWLLWVGEP